MFSARSCVHKQCSQFLGVGLVWGANWYKYVVQHNWTNIWLKKMDNVEFCLGPVLKKIILPAETRRKKKRLDQFLTQIKAIFGPILPLQPKKSMANAPFSDPG